MKTLKFSTMLCVLFLFVVNTVIAQPEKKNFGESTSPFSGYAFCGTEVVTGTLTTEWKVSDPYWNWFQLKSHWSLVGAESDAHYEAQEVTNVHFHIPTSGVETGNLTVHMFVKKDNVPLGFVHNNYHYTVNANGDLTVEFDKWVAECF
jgi:hypothetical protein